MALLSRRRIKWALSVLGVLIAIWLGSAMVVAFQLTHRPRPRFEEPQPELTWSAVKTERLKTSDGEQIGAWYLEAPNAKATLILVHGNGGCRSDNLGIAQRLYSRGYSSLLISVRAHGDSTGDVNDIGYSARNDVIAAVDYLEAHQPGRPIFVLGRSLGAAATAFAGTQLDHRVRGYVLDSAYKDLRTAVHNRLEDRLPWGADEIAYGGLIAVSRFFVSDIDAISPVNAVAKIPADIPVLLISGGKDRSARPVEAQAIYSACRSHADCRIFPNAGHDVFSGHPEEYCSDVIEFIEKTLTPNQKSLP